VVCAEFFRELLFIFFSGDATVSTPFSWKTECPVTEAADSSMATNLLAALRCFAVIDVVTPAQSSGPASYAKFAWNQRKRTSGGDHVSA